MSDRESGDGKMGAFLLGFILGVLVCLGVGGVFVFRQSHIQEQLAEMAAMERDRARAEEMAARMAAEAARKAMEALKKAEEKAKMKEKEQEKDNDKK